MSKKYTGKKIAIINNIGGVLESLEAIIIDCQTLGVEKIYSTGNNIGEGPDSDIVIDTLIGYNIKSVAGALEKYCTFKIKPTDIRILPQMLRMRENLIPQLREERLKEIGTLPDYYELNVGGKKIIICSNVDDINPKDIPPNCCDIIIQGGVEHNTCSTRDETTIYTIKSSTDHNHNKDCFNIATYFVLYEKQSGMGFDIIERRVLYNERNLHSPIESERTVTGKTKRLVQFLPTLIQPQV